ncbi:MAG: hypothetical protein DCC58_03490 [Chloroflexi bacterium]|nr:MAG: hypothetical protein DCC58_03490 [Chloroflexota bacterium]
MDRHACAECRELISAFIDGELAQDERARMMAHLSECVDCRETLEVYRLIGARMRALPAVPPPDHLIDSIFAETIDAQPRRLFIVTSRLGYSVAAVAAVLLIFVVAVYLIVGGYQRGLSPQVASSEPRNGETWPIQNPIEITFNKKMDRESVAQALAILPEEEDKRLLLSWEGNTLIIGQNQTLKPGTSYHILIGTSAVDTFGNRLESDFRLSFGTTSTVQVPENPTVTPMPSATAVPTEPPRSPTSAPTAVRTATPASTQAPVVSATATPDGGGGPAVTATPGGPPVATNPTVEVDPTEEPTATPTASPTLEPEPTVTVAPSPIATATVPPTATAPAQPTATATQTPTAPAATATPQSIPVTGGFGQVYWSDPTIQSRLGQPLAPASSIGALQLGFQHGAMYYRSDLGLIYVLSSTTQTWGSFLDTSTSVPEPQPAPEPELWVPGGIFGYLWSAEPSVSADLGYAIQQYPASFSAQVQQFEGGVMLSSPDTIWVIYDDLTWDWFGNTGG